MDTVTNKLLGGRITLHQPIKGYRAAIDPVLLAAATPAKKGMKALDAGCGVGTAALCLAARVDGLEITGIDIQLALVELARHNAAENDMADQYRFIDGDITALPKELNDEKGTFDIVITNPPFLDPAAHSPSPNEMVNTAHTGKLADWTTFAAEMLKPKGRLIMVHRADHLPQIMAALSEQFGDIVTYPLWPRAGRAAKRVLVGAVYGSNAPATLREGMVLHEGETDSAYTAPAHAVLYDTAGIDLWP